MNNKLFNLNISEDLREKIREEAYKRKTTLSAAARNILEEYFINKNANCNQGKIKADSTTN